jgi:hypothetical protein
MARPRFAVFHRLDRTRSFAIVPQSSSSSYSLFSSFPDGSMLAGDPRPFVHSGPFAVFNSLCFLCCLLFKSSLLSSVQMTVAK